MTDTSDILTELREIRREAREDRKELRHELVRVHQRIDSKADVDQVTQLRSSVDAIERKLTPTKSIKAKGFWAAIVQNPILVVVALLSLLLVISLVALIMLATDRDIDQILPNQATHAGEQTEDAT